MGLEKVEKVDLVNFYRTMQEVSSTLTDEKLKAGTWLVLDFIRESLENSSATLPISAGAIQDNEQCAICSGSVVSWRGDKVLNHSDRLYYKQDIDYTYYAYCSCSFAKGTSEIGAKNNRLTKAKNKFSDEALSDDPGAAVVRRQLKEEHEKQIDELNSKLAESAARELDARRRVQMLEAEVDALSAERTSLYAEIDGLQDELENQAEEPLKQSEVVIPVKIKIQVEH